MHQSGLVSYTHASSRMFVCVDFVSFSASDNYVNIKHTHDDVDDTDETTDFYRSLVRVGRRTVGDHRLMYSHLNLFIFHVLFRGALSIPIFFSCIVTVFAVIGQF